MCIAISLIGIALMAPGGVFWQEQGIVPCNGPDCNFCHLAQLGQNIINLAVTLSVFVAAVLFAYAGWNYLTNFGDTGKVSKAHGIFKNVAVGFIIIMAAWLIVDTLMKVFLGGGFGPWNEVCGGSAAALSQTGGLIQSGAFDVYQFIDAQE